MRNQPGRITKLEQSAQVLTNAERLSRLSFVIEQPEAAAILYGAQVVNRIHGLLEIAKRRRIAGLQDLAKRTS